MIAMCQTDNYLGFQRDFIWDFEEMDVPVCQLDTR